MKKINSTSSQLPFYLKKRSTEDEPFVYEVLTQESDLEDIAMGAAKSFSGHNRVIKHLGIDAEDYYHIIRFYFEEAIKQKSSILIRDTKSNAIVSSSLVIDAFNAPVYPYEKAPKKILPFIAFLDEISKHLPFSVTDPKKFAYFATLYTNPKYFGLDFATKNYVMQTYFLAQQGYSKMYGEYISEKGYHIATSILDDTELRRHSILYRNFSYNGTKPLDVDGELIACIWQTKLKPEITQWASRQTISFSDASKHIIPFKHTNSMNVPMSFNKRNFSTGTRTFFNPLNNMLINPNTIRFVLKSI